MTNSTRTRPAAIMALAAFVVGIATGPVWATSPGKQIQATANQVLEILNDPKLQGDANRNVIRSKLRETILPRFDFSEMSRRALGRHWTRHPEKQKEFVTAFAQLLEDTYVVQVEGAAGDKIVLLNERTEGNLAAVNTKIVSPRGQETAVSYRLHKVGADWKVYDVVVENVSLVNNYRSQFNRILTNSSMDDLIRRINDKRIAQSG